MLCSLNIRDFVIVDKLDLEFSDGFTALTGETGAGKSILIDALQLLFGARSDPEVIRSGAQKSDLTASFTINDKIKAWLEERELSRPQRRAGFKKNFGHQRPKPFLDQRHNLLFVSVKRTQPYAGCGSWSACPPISASQRLSA